MNAFAQGTGPLWDALGWTMLHFLWIGALIGLAAAILRLAVGRRTPQTRYAVSLAAFAVLAIAPVCLFIWKIKEPAAGSSIVAVALPAPSERDFPKHNLPARDQKTGATARSMVIPSPIVDATSAPTTIQQAPTSFGKRLVAGYELAVRVFPWVWVVGFPLTGLWLVIGIGGAERLRRQCRAVEDEGLLALCRRLQSVLRVSGSVAIGISDRIAAPILVGIVRPAILLPTAALAGWTPEQVEMILLHELAHIRRWDNLVNLLQRLVEAALFFHPVVWWLSNCVRLEREHCCDAVVLAHTHAPQAYAETLAQIALPDLAPRWALGSSATAQLVARIRRILKQEDQPMQVSRKSIALFLAVSLGLVGLAVAWAKTDRARDGSRSADLMRSVKRFDENVERHATVMADAAAKPATKTVETTKNHVDQTVPTAGGTGRNSTSGKDTPESRREFLGFAPAPPLRFEGKTFDVWQEQARTELKPESRAEAIRAFGRFGSHAGYTEKSIAAIIESLKSDRLSPDDAGDQKVVEAGHWAFARIGAPAIGALIGLLKDPDLEVRRFAVVSLRQFLSAEPTAKRQAFDAVVQATKDPNSQIRAAAFRALRTVLENKNSDEAKVLVQTAIDLLHDEQSFLRRDAAEILGELGPKAASATPALLAAVKDPRNEKDSLEAVKDERNPTRDKLFVGVPSAAIDALGRVGAPPDAVVPTLIEVLGNSSADTQTLMAAVRRLGQYGRKAGPAVPALIEAFKQAERRAIEASATTRPQPDYELETRLQIRIVAALGKIGPEARAALPLLEKKYAELTTDAPSELNKSSGELLQTLASVIPEMGGTKVRHK